MIRSVLAALALATALQQTTPTGQAGLDRAIDEYLRLRLPPGPCAIAGMAGRIAQAVGMPVGVEYPPVACAAERTPASNDSEQLELYGLTAREALDRLVALDPRFRWIESDGVVVMRPNQAWDDPRHFLHRSIPEFNLAAKGIGNASRAVQTVLSGNSHQTMSGSSQDSMLEMPNFGSAYSDTEVAAVANYVTSRFGSAPSKVTASDVAGLKKEAAF